MGNNNRRLYNTNESGGHLDSCAMVSGNTNGKLRGSKSTEPVENSTDNAISSSRDSSIYNDTNSHGTPRGISQEKYPVILDDTTSIVSNDEIIEST